MFKKINTVRDINHLVEMAHEIWSEYFGSLFDSETLPKVIEAAQSRRVILSHMKHGQSPPMNIGVFQALV